MRMDIGSKLVGFAWRNLWRRSSRTVLLGLSLLLMTALAVFLLGMSSGISRQMVGGAIDNFLGEAIAFSSQSKEDALWPESLVEFDPSGIRKALPEGGSVRTSAQYRAKVFCYSDQNEQGLLLVGIEDIKLKDRITLVSGSYPESGENGILLTSSVSKKLRAKTGDFITVEAVTPDGRRNVDKYFVSGTYRFNGVSELFAGHMVVAPLSSVQRLLDVPDTSVTEVLLNSSAGGLVVGDLPKIEGISYAGWSAYGSLILSVAKSMIISIWIIFAITMTVILVFLYDSIKSTIEERRVELGIMFSIGLSGGQIMGLFLAEIFILGAMFVIPGALLGVVSVSLMGMVGLSVKSEAVRVVLGGLDRLYPVNNYGMAGAIAAGALFVMQYVGVLSLLKITKMKPVESLKN